MFHHLSEISHPVIGYATAMASGAGYYLAQHTDAIPVQARGWMELGGTLGLIGGLSYGCVTLWKALQEQRKESATNAKELADKAADERKAFLAAKDALELEIRTDWKQQNARLIAVLEKIDPDNN